MAAQLLPLFRTRATLVWAALIAATLISWTIGTSDGLHARLATTVILLVAFVKVRFIGMYFMELRDAPIQLRGIFEAYCLVVAAVLITIYLATSG
jgi:heme/copper-type cytochrome/quinol oxidase subunit 4